MEWPIYDYNFLFLLCRIPIVLCMSDSEYFVAVIGDGNTLCIFDTSITLICMQMCTQEEWIGLQLCVSVRTLRENDDDEEENIHSHAHT